jgi:hypothetical protein
MMEMIRGDAGSVQNQIETRLTEIEGTTLCRSSRNETSFYPKYNNMAAQLNI